MTQIKTEHDRKRRVSLLRNHPAEYLASHVKDYEAALENENFFTPWGENKLLKAMCSQEPESGSSAVYWATSRAACLCYHGQCLLQRGDPSGWKFIDHACDLEWWEVRIQKAFAGEMWFAYYALLGNRHRSDYLGKKWLEIIREDAERKISDETNFLVLRLWAWQRGIKIDFLANTPAPGYAALWERFLLPCDATLMQALYVALDFRLLSCSNTHGGMAGNYPFYLFPIEILYYLKLRKLRGFATDSIDHPVMTNVLAQYPEDLAFVAREPDLPLRQALEKAARQGLIEADEIQKSYARAPLSCPSTLYNPASELSKETR